MALNFSYDEVDQTNSEEELKRNGKGNSCMFRKSDAVQKLLFVHQTAAKVPITALWWRDGVHRCYV